MIPRAGMRTEDTLDLFLFRGLLKFVKLVKDKSEHWYYFT